MKKACVTGAILLLPVLALAQGGPPGNRQITVETLIVEPSRLDSTVEAVGTVLADASALLRSEVPGQVIERHFEEGQQVRKGEPLFSIEATVLEAEANEARANVEQSEAAYKRAQELVKSQLVSATDFDTARANYNVAVARMHSAEARLSKTVIRAPFDGFIGLRRINVGDYATIGQELVNVVRLDPLRVDFSVPETLLARVQPGQTIAVTVGAFGGEVFPGEVTAIDPQIDVTGHSMAVRARLPNPDLKLRPGLFAQVAVSLAVKPDALLVPEEAIWPIGNDKILYVVEDGVANQRVVTIGDRKPGMVEIVDGLAAGEEIVVAGQMKLFPGAAVRAVPATAAGTG
ncbi:MAG: efflux RND transporter periplasmic adaptor subunit [Gammaproteobacteria bacterium]|nr:efflux RND transporter periplasmic adaptor subunit [Gammaproteobacteria bacterium]MDH5344341.1 efflux RND transporter periplasmic adaptor subunit [Gammaproteobacteria bacterium]